MLSINQALIHEVPLFTPSSTYKEANAFLQASGYAILPITQEDNTYIGNILAEDIECEEYQNIEELLYLTEKAALINDRDYSIPEVLSLLYKYDLNILPVISPENQLIGIVKKQEIQDYWQNTHFAQSHGIYIYLAKAEKNLSIAQVAQIVESNDAKLYGLIQVEQVEHYIHLLIKTDGVNTSKILDDFRRFDYNVLNQLDQDEYLNDLKEKADYLNKYLNI